jgi:Tat protein secretion system quality control protein TatD with DNase activity
MYQGEYHGNQVHEPDLDAVLHRAWDVGVEKIIITAGTLSESRAALELAKTDDRLFCTVGVHPTRCGEFETYPDGPEAYMAALSAVRACWLHSVRASRACRCHVSAACFEMLPQPMRHASLARAPCIRPASATHTHRFLTSGTGRSFWCSAKMHKCHARCAQVLSEGVALNKAVAVGECGLDYDREQFCDRETQQRYFAAQFELVRESRLPMFLHLRAAAPDFGAIMLKHLPLFRGVVHQPSRAHACSDHMHMHVAITRTPRTMPCPCCASV